MYVKILQVVSLHFLFLFTVLFISHSDLFVQSVKRQLSNRAMRELSICQYTTKYTSYDIFILLFILKTDKIVASLIWTPRLHRSKD